MLRLWKCRVRHKSIVGVQDDLKWVDLHDRQGCNEAVSTVLLEYSSLV